MYDLLIFANFPSFYKINLYNEISKNKKIFVVYLTTDSDKGIKTHDFDKIILYDYIILSNTVLEKRNRFTLYIKLLKYAINQQKYKRIIYPAWDITELYFLSFITKKSKNCLQCESTIYESSTNGYKGLIKKLFLRNFSVGLPSGIPHKELLLKLNFKGELYLTNGVGILNKSNRARPKKIESKIEYKYLFIGRLEKEKNLEYLVNSFNENKKQLSIVGDGSQRNHLQSIANSNISFLGFIPNNELYKIYESHDIFILPSITETWGLVIEEALYHELPVIVNESVGSKKDLILKYNTGCIFTYNEKGSLDLNLEIIERNYVQYLINIKEIDFNLFEKNKVLSYIQL